MNPRKLRLGIMGASVPACHNARNRSRHQCTYVPAIPITPTLSRIFAISLTDKTPLLAQKKSSQAMEMSFSVANSFLNLAVRDMSEGRLVW